VATKVGNDFEIVVGNVRTNNEKWLQVGMRIMAVGDLSCHGCVLVGIGWLVANCGTGAAKSMMH
jgi:hypothetical protein